MGRQLYIMHLDDPAKPGYCSFEKPYFGFKEEFLMVKALMEGYENYANTAKAIGDYLDGHKKATHSIAYTEQPVLKRTRVYAKHELEFKEKTWEHTNIWGFPYQMKCEKGYVKQIIVKYEGKYCRCIRVWFLNLSYRHLADGWTGIDHFWGNKEIMLIYHLSSVEVKLNNILYIIDKKYDTLNEAIDSLTNPEELCFASFCEEVFGDG